MADAIRSRFGEVAGYPPGSWFPTRVALAQARVHPPLQAGISGSATVGADSIVLSGGYEDDLDLGDMIVYTGHGGNDPSTGKQIADQTLTRQNLALAVSCQEGMPVRVTRGARHPSELSPPTGYRYDGVYRVDAFWSETGRSGFTIWRFRLQRIVDDAPQPDDTAAAVPNTPAGSTAPARRSVTAQRVVRNSVVAQYVKSLYDYRCQVCGVRLETAGGPYSEAAHIRPLGQPHNGPDVLANVLCLCPNHHVLFDFGGIVITEDLVVVETHHDRVMGDLRVHPKHALDPDAVTYHRTLFLRSR